MDDRLLEPASSYRDYYKEQFETNAQAYFDDLLLKSGVNVEQNRRTVREYEELSQKRDNAKITLYKKKSWRAVHIALCVGCFIVGVLGIWALVQEFFLEGGIMTPVGFCLGIPLILVILRFNRKIKLYEEEYKRRRKEAQKVLDRAWEEMAPLNALFDGRATKALVEKTVPLIQLDDDFNMRRYDYLSGKYGFGENDNEEASTIAILTGEILGNPFVVDREIYKINGTEKYTGSLLITWTTTYTDSEGHVYTEHHSQTLVASVTKFKPYYSERTRLIYGNEAAPDLHFSHRPSHAELLSEKELKSRVASGMKRIRKQQQRDLKKGESNFTEMGNEEFDVLFGATDRNNEVQFRLLFTPLAQKNMLTLMKSKNGFGDDFYFRKAGCLNFISSEHSAQWQPDIDYHSYYSYSVDLSRKSFVSQNCSYFKSLFFDLAPLLSIPLYQQHKPHEYLYKETYERNYTSYEAEYAANRMGQASFAHPTSGTASILKTRFLGKDGDSDRVSVTAHSYRVEDRIDFVPVLGGDGDIHAVPVPWKEYIPVREEKVVSLKRLGVTDREFEVRSSGDDPLRETLGRVGLKSSYGHGILCCLLKMCDTAFDGELNAVLNK